MYFMKNLLVSIALPFLAASALAQDPTLACVEEMKTNAELQILYKKLPLDISKGQSLEVLSNKTKPTAIEKKYLLNFMETLDACGALGTEWRAKNYPLAVNNLAAKFQTDFKVNLADLYSGDLTFGELAKIRSKMMTEYIANLQVEVEKIKQERSAKEQAAASKAQSDLERDQQQTRAAADRDAQIAAQREAMAEDTRRQAILQLMRTQPFQLQPIPMPRAPITTNCNSFGNQFNCTTR